MKLTVGKIEISLQKPVVMAIVNVTPDSFFSGSRTQEADAIEAAVAQVLKEGYRTIDIMSEGKTQVGTEEMGSLIAERI